MHKHVSEVKEELFRRMESCDLCPRDCRVNRLENELGICKTGRRAKVSSYGPHHGEERCLSGTRGSGTIFFTHCNLLCNFCQNFDISHLGHGREKDDEELAGIIIKLQESGCHNINFVTPSHVIPQIAGAFLIAKENGLNIPVVYNSGGYDKADSLKMLEGIIDIYMPDIKFSDPAVAAGCCDAPDYFETAKKAVKEMHRQTGDLETDANGIARRGLLIRHLVMPGGMAGTEKIMKFLAEEISPDTAVNIMDQYYPCGNIPYDSPLNRRISPKEYKQALTIAQNHKLNLIGN